MARTAVFRGQGVIHATISDRIDGVSQDPQKRYAFLKDLKDWKKDYFEILKNHGVLKTSDEVQHYKKHWFNQDKQGWWKGHPMADNFEKMHRQGMIEAFGASVDLDKPIETYWITGVQDFRIYICYSGQQVTRLLLTPSIPDLGKEEIERLTEKQSIRMVRYLDPKDSDKYKNVNKKNGVHAGEELLYRNETDDKIGILRIKGEPDSLKYD